MYKTFLIVILSLVLSSVFSQEMNSKVIKIYSGPFNSDKPYDLSDQMKLEFLMDFLIYHIITRFLFQVVLLKI